MDKQASGSRWFDRAATRVDDSTRQALPDGSGVGYARVPRGNNLTLRGSLGERAEEVAEKKEMLSQVQQLGWSTTKPWLRLVATR